MLMPVKCNITVTNILHWWPYFNFHIFYHLCIPCFVDILCVAHMHNAHALHMI